MTGQAQSDDYPTTPGAFDRTLSDGGDAFITKLNKAGSALAYSTFLGATGVTFPDVGFAIAVDHRGRAIVTGYTDAPDFPTTANAFDATINGPLDAFVTRLNRAGSELSYSTFLGGTGGEVGFDVAVDNRLKPYVTGWTSSSDYPTTPGAFDRTADGSPIILEVYVTKLTAPPARRTLSRAKR